MIYESHGLRCAYDLDLLISRQPRTAIRSYHPTRANTPLPNELEYLDVFDLFNFPRIPMAPDIGNGTNGDGQHHPTAQMLAPTEINAIHAGPTNIPNFAVPNPDADWLFNAR